MTIVNIASEDEISENLAKKLVREIVAGGEIGISLRRGGNGYLSSRFESFCRMARREYVFLLADLDRISCAPKLVADWAGDRILPDKLVFRVAVREVEGWLLADRTGMAQILSLSEAALPAEPDALPDPKQTLLNLARRAPRDIRSELVAGRDALASQGLGYNRVLSDFISTVWSPERAADRSPSLKRAISRLSQIG